MALFIFLLLLCNLFSFCNLFLLYILHPLDPSYFLATPHPAPQPSCLHPLDRSSFHISSPSSCSSFFLPSSSSISSPSSRPFFFSCHSSSCSPAFLSSSSRPFFFSHFLHPPPARHSSCLLPPMHPPLLSPQISSFLATPRHHPPHPTLQLPLRSLQPSSSYSTSASSTSSYEPFFFLSGHPSPSSSLYSSSSASFI